MRSGRGTRGWSWAKITRRNITISLQNGAGKTVISWNFAAAFPKKFVGPRFDANNAQVAIQEMVIAHEGMSQVTR